MASSYSELYSLTYTGAVDNSGNGVKAQFDFQGLDRGNSFQPNSTWSVSLSNTDGPMCALVANNQTVSGVTAKILTSAYESGNIYTGTLEMYPLTAGTTYILQAYDEGGTPEVYITFTPTLNNNPRAKDLASGTLAESVSASTTTLLVYVGEGGATTIRGVWPDTPFYASIMPASPSAGVANSLDSEIVKVTAVSNDQVGNTALTVTRAQRGTTGKAFTAGAIVTNADYAEDAVLLGDEGTPENPTPWVGTDDIENGSITAGKLSKTDSLVLLDSFKLATTTSLGSITLTVPSELVSKVEEAFITFCLANASSTSEYIRFYVNTTSPDSVITNFLQIDGTASSNTTNCGACVFPANSNILCSGEMRVATIANSWQKLGWYNMVGAEWRRTGSFTVSTNSVPGIQSIIFQINNGSPLAVRYGSWARLYGRLKEE